MSKKPIYLGFLANICYFMVYIKVTKIANDKIIFMMLNQVFSFYVSTFSYFILQQKIKYKVDQGNDDVLDFLIKLMAKMSYTKANNIHSAETYQQRLHKRTLPFNCFSRILCAAYSTEYVSCFKIR